MLSIKSQIDSRIRSTIDDILVYSTECRDKISLYTPQKEKANDYYENYKGNTLNNIISIAERTISLYDNNNSILGMVFNRLIASRLNDILRATLETIRDNAIEYKNSFDTSDLEECSRTAIIEILNSIITTAKNGLNIYTDDLIRHSVSDRENDFFIT